MSEPNQEPAGDQPKDPSRTLLDQLDYAYGLGVGAVIGEKV